MTNCSAVHDKIKYKDIIKYENQMWNDEVILISLYYYIIFTLKKKKYIGYCVRYLKILDITDLNVVCRT